MDELALGGSFVRKRKSYTREDKLKIVNYYCDNGKNLYQTCKRFSQNTKTVQRWLQAEEKTRDSTKGSMCVKFEQRAEQRREALTANTRT